jgi:hypothetical protein
MNTFDVQAEFQGNFRSVRPHTHFIAVHHAAATFSGQQGIDHVRAVARFHVDERKWPGIGYHVCLAEETRGGPIARYNVSDLEAVRAHVFQRNSEAVGVVCLTDFASRVPEQKWVDALVEVLRELKVRYPNAEIMGHRDLALSSAPTACPGGRWADWKSTLLERVAAGTSTDSPSGDDSTPDLPAGGTVTSASTLLVSAQATPEQCSAYILSRPTGEYNEHDVKNVIVPAYFRVCERAAINPLLAIAQMIHETGNLTSWWAGRPRRNPAGIGVTGETRTDDPGDPERWARNDERGVFAAGLSFPTWTDHGIPAQVGRLLAYALPDTASLTADQRQLIAFALTVRPLPDRLRGSAPTLDGLVGTWAVPGRQLVGGREVTYADSIADIARRILSR